MKWCICLSFGSKTPPMDLYNVELKPFKSKFFPISLITLLAVITTFALLTKGVYLLANFDPGKKLTWPIFGVMIILAGIHSQQQKKKLSKLWEIEDFTHRVSEYQKLYGFRLLWFLFSCLLSCGLAILTGRQLFAYFGAFDLVMVLFHYPSLMLFKRELKNDEIFFV